MAISPGVRRLQFGCGAFPAEGWINSNLTPGPGVDVSCDIRDGLPIASESIRYIASMHALVGAGWELSYVDEVVVHHHPSEASRDTTRRRTTITRNHLWVAWMRYPWRWALRATARAALAAWRDRAARAGLGAAVRALPWALGRRHVVPAEVRRRLRQIGTI